MPNHPKIQPILLCSCNSWKHRFRGGWGGNEFAKSGKIANQIMSITLPPKKAITSSTQNRSDALKLYWHDPKHADPQVFFFHFLNNHNVWTYYARRRNSTHAEWTARPSCWGLLLQCHHSNFLVVNLCDFAKKKSLWKNWRKYFFQYKLCIFRKISALVQNAKVEKSGRLPWSKKPTYQNTWFWMMVIPTKCNNSYILSLWI